MMPLRWVESWKARCRWECGSQDGLQGLRCDVILNDYEHVRLFDGVLFEHHAYAADPRASKAFQERVRRA